MASTWLTSGAHLLEGPVGAMEVLVDAPAQPRGLAIMAHPQPLLGGSAQHKVPHFLAKALADAGWCVLRPNFRGVGRSAGQHDQGEGETQDLLWLVDAARAQTQGLPLALIGISFGSFVQARVATQLQTQGHAAQGVVLAAMPFGEVEGGRRYDTPQNIDNALVVHGELDERVPLTSALDWARPASQVVSVVPGADHLFTGKLPILRSLILNFLTQRFPPKHASE
jgi:alpha/beta superfamily hydrolase